MDKDTLKQLLLDINSYYGMDNSHITTKRFSQWHERLKNIPNECIDFVKEKLFTEKDSVPRNIPKYVKAYFHEWISSHPEKYQPHTKTVCNECDGDGLIYYIDKTGQYPVNRVARCPFCENWKSILGWEAVKNYPIRTKKDLMESGYILQYGG